MELENSPVQIISAFLPLRSWKPLGSRCLPTPHPPLTLPIFNPAPALLSSPSVRSQELPWAPAPRLTTPVCCSSALKMFLPFISGASKGGDGWGCSTHESICGPPQALHRWSGVQHTPMHVRTLSLGPAHYPLQTGKSPRWNLEKQVWADDLDSFHFHF